MQIREDDLSGPEVAALLQAHLDTMVQHSPPGSMHALDLDGLRAPCVAFWTVWDGAELAGCGGLKELDPEHGEIKSMHTSAAHRRKGVAAMLLEHILDVARQRTYTRLSLETGAADAYAGARALYAAYGFDYTEPFADYVPDPSSVFMTLRL